LQIAPPALEHFNTETPPLVPFPQARLSQAHV